MDAKIAEALEASILHWKQNAVADLKDVSVTSADCALCALFVKQTEGCIGCPVRGHTERGECEDTPYINCWYRFHAWRRCPEDKTAQNAFRAAALREVAFLESLREGDLKCKK